MMSRRPSGLPPFFFMTLFVILVVLVSLVLWEWTLTIDINTQALDRASNESEILVAETILDQMQILNAVNTSTFNLVKVLGSSVKENPLTFSYIEKQVAPSLFLALSTIPFLSQVSYIGRDGLFYSYHRDRNQILAVFSNTSWSSSDHSGHLWYGKAVHGDTGIAYGDAIDLTQSSTYSYDWIKMALQHSSNVVLLAQGLRKDQNLSFLFTAPLLEVAPTRDQQGVVSLGILLDSFVDHIFRIHLDGGALYLATKDGKVLAQRGSVISLDVTEEMTSDASCGLNNDPFIMTNSNAQHKKYQLHCIPIHIVGIQMVSILALPLKDGLQHVHKMAIAALSGLLAMLIMVAFASCIMIQFTRMYQNKEVLLNASLIKQKQATQQAERKSMNKSLAFANASHDVRTSLAGITGLIELSRGVVSEKSQMENNLDQMSVCASKLLDILNSVLDISKVEAGKMQLEEIEFDMAQVIEESIDIFYVVALKKGLEVIWDPCDCSLLKILKVKGDCRRLKQILDNLLGNAVKFTSNGHVVVRAWAKKTSVQGSTLSSNHGCQPRNIWGPLGRLFCKSDGSYDDLNSTDPAHSGPDYIEFIFEIDDTGKGIPKEKRASVFENYVQVKESACEGHQGTGLGLGIVQSYVRLMGGEIGILDKKLNEKGTCFRFNIFLKSVETGETDRGVISTISQVSHESQNPEISASTEPQQPGLHPIIKLDNKFLTFSKGLKKDGIHIHVLLFVQGKETRIIAKGWMENLGVKVWDVNCIEQFGPTLEKLRHSLILGYLSASGTHKVHSNNSSPSYISEIGEMEGSPACIKEGFDHNLFLKRTSSKRLMTHVLVILDVFYKPLSEMLLTLKSFAKDVYRHQYKIIWLADSNTPSTELRILDDAQTPCDLVLRKPFHGSRLCEVLRILQDFGGPSEGQQTESKIQIVTEKTNVSSQAGPSKESKQVSFNLTSSPPNAPIHERYEPKTISTHNKPLTGINVLVVEDTLPLRYVASAILSQLGASVTFAENGQRAVSLVHQALEILAGGHEDNASKSQVSKCFLYDLILMDCEMPIMNGYEATRQIRIEEKRNGLHIPIIATSAHESDEYGYKSINAGMDFHITKPLQKDKILDAIRRVNKNKNMSHLCVLHS